ncbi:hypothetical protein KMZ68_02260 [Bradyrhizobium sediminis]|uniref:Uncharacterized protein n=1 Tax=Bradyrhizobium sediminis TaxID=2840469 RepID=A0A975NQC8_9BRAD|nr:hypothetical protein [Bradyrhizobium sediminis]QWG18741.1 hypothetical protein KMZ68_02260 [Bradyrhizobium sediminis]
MQKAAGAGTSIRSDVRDGGHHSIVSELVSLIEHVQASVTLLEAARARETALGHREAARQRCRPGRRHASLRKSERRPATCNAGLGAALRFLLDAGPSDHGAASRKATASEPGEPAIAERRRIAILPAMPPLPSGFGESILRR